jgi:hypothetical protein
VRYQARIRRLKQCEKEAELPRTMDVFPAADLFRGRCPGLWRSGRTFSGSCILVPGVVPYIYCSNVSTATVLRKTSAPGLTHDLYAVLSLRLTLSTLWQTTAQEGAAHTPMTQVKSGQRTTLRKTSNANGPPWTPGDLRTPPRVKQGKALHDARDSCTRSLHCVS